MDILIAVLVDQDSVEDQVEDQDSVEDLDLVEDQAVALVLVVVISLAHHHLMDHLENLALIKNGINKKPGNRTNIANAS